MSASGTASFRRTSLITLLDGGMGTTLESLGHDVSSPLWGCDLLQTNPQAISEIHNSFIASGAELIETSTYQLTRQGLMDHAPIPDYEAETIMRSAVHLAHSSLANTSFNANPNPAPNLSTSTSTSTNRGIVLALGPYGATLRPGQEYAGIYPPPFGPPPRPSSIPIQTNHIRSDDAHTSQKHLAEFHYQRLLIFALDKDTWDKVDYIAFETIPLIREIRAVRQAMKMLRDRDPEKVQVQRKKFWITSAFPGGEHPQMNARGGRVRVGEVLEAMLDNPVYRVDLPVPDAVGINCTNPSYLPGLVNEFTTELSRFEKDRGLDKSVDWVTSGRPGFVLYPDGGCTYDVVTRQWTEGKGDAKSWAKSVAGVARQLAETGQWGGVIVGGCCKAGFEEIAALRAELDQRQE